MIRLPVHCCCNPEKRLGTIDVPDRCDRPMILWLHTAPRWERGLTMRSEQIRTEIAEL